ncbi:Ig-like domain-containing surface protein [Brevibacillus choshinensis]|uniref:Ig-like domain-containing surface protein n=1 Tax=Brevibacillus choshinensis TaxID=54911 RepID=A0ABR5N1I7_BRECH|nr:Ig-like domain-containing protein [Brevibacillus choshinensis]KQL44360.1 Ig-like domain-containing surface protein [Brevibacillus choshinensis]
MKRMKRNIFQTLTVALATVCAVHFAFPTATFAQSLTKVQAANSEGLTVSTSAINVVKGKTGTLKLKYNGQTLDSSRATWTTSNSSIATVSNGVVTGRGTGTTFVTVRYSGETVKVKVTVSAPDELKANITKTTLKKGKEQTIDLTYNGSTLQGSKAIWSSSNSSVATVKNGVITAKANGTAIIGAKYKDLTVYVDVTVESNSSGKLEANESKIKLDKGDEETIKLKYDDESLSGSKASWSTSKSSVATVDDGVVTAKGKGTATITAKYKNDKVEIEVIVGGGGSSSDLLEADETDITLKKGDKETIKLYYDDKIVSASSATWTTSKSSVATVSKGVVTAKGNGTATITAKYKGEKVEIEVTVKNSDKLEADSSSMSLKKGKKEEIQLYYDDKELKGSKATWSTSDSSVATVKDGVVTAKKKGTATITAKYKDESVKVKVTVKS